MESLIGDALSGLAEGLKQVSLVVKTAANPSNMTMVFFIITLMELSKSVERLPTFGPLSGSSTLLILSLVQGPVIGRVSYFTFESWESS